MPEMSYFMSLVAFIDILIPILLIVLITRGDGHPATPIGSARVHELEDRPKNGPGL